MSSCSSVFKAQAKRQHVQKYLLSEATLTDSSLCIINVLVSNLL
jgi:hypothetical protein